MLHDLLVPAEGTTRSFSPARVVRRRVGTAPRSTFCWAGMVPGAFAHPTRDSGRSKSALIGVTAVVVPQNLSSNERIRIATDDPVARDHIVGMHANARAESVVRVRLGIIRRGCGTIPLG